MTAPRPLPESKVCPRCEVEKPRAEFRIIRYPSGNPGLSVCVACDCATSSHYRATHDRDERNAKLSAYAKGPGRARNRRASQESKRRLRAEVIEAYGGRCACCGETMSGFLSVDHIYNDGVEHRREVPGWRLYTWLRQNGFPKDRFQLLCMNCNFAKGRYGTCPHEVAAYDVPYAVNMEAV